MLNKKIILGMAALVLLAGAVWVGGCGTSPKPGDTSGKNDKSCDKCDEYSTSGKEDCNQESCGVIKERAKKGWFGETLFRHRWWNYYERAMSWAECGKWECAIADLQQALKQRLKDQWDARTYGMRFIDYFPNRELGIAYYYSGNFPKAKDCLECSLEQTPSDKALVYLERAYKILVQKDGVIPKPNITIFNNEPELWKQDTFTLSGTVKDNKYIKSIRINVRKKTDNNNQLNFTPIFLLNGKEDLKKEVIFHKQLSLQEDKYIITVEAENIIGEKSRITKDVSINVDALGPSIAVKEIKYDSNEKVNIKVVLKDEKTEVSDFSVNTETENPTVKKTKIDPNILEADFTLINPDKPVELIAYDKVKNKTVTSLPASFIIANKPKLFANLNLTDNNSSIQSDNKPPEINIGNFKIGNNDVYLKKMSESKSYKINIDIKDDSKISYVKVNGNIEADNLERSFVFYKSIDLENETTIEAADKIGNKTIRIINKKKSDNNTILNEDKSILLALAGNNFFTARDIIQSQVEDNQEIKSNPKIKDAFKLENRLKLLVYHFFHTGNATNIGRTDFSSYETRVRLRDSISNQIAMIPCSNEVLEIENPEYKRFNIVAIENYGNFIKDDNSLNDKRLLKNMAKKMNADLYIEGEVKIITIPFTKVKELQNLENYDREKKEEFIKAVETKIGTDETDLFKTEILKYASYDCCLLTTNSDKKTLLDSLNNNGVSENVINKLEEADNGEFLTKKYDNEDLFKSALRNILTDDEYKQREKEILNHMKCKYYINAYAFNMLNKNKKSGIEIKAPIQDPEGEIKIGDDKPKTINSYEEILNDPTFSNIADKLSKKYLPEFPFAYDDDIDSCEGEIITAENISNDNIKQNSPLIIYDEKVIVGDARVDKAPKAHLVSLRENHKRMIQTNPLNYGTVTK